LRDQLHRLIIGKVEIIQAETDELVCSENSENIQEDIHQSHGLGGCTRAKEV
jgi:hypothetical protein